MFDVWQRFQIEIKANGKKAGLLAGLILFGCCFWIPMLARAVKPNHASAAVANHIATTVPSPPTANSLNVSGPVPADSERFWSDLAKALSDDPMYHSADVESLSRDPFQGPGRVDPPAVAVVEEPKVAENPKVEPEPQTLLLSSTIISRTRKAALINGQLYQLGRRIQANGRSYLLAKIESHRVVLTSEEETIELTLARTQLKDVLDQGLNPR